jgi:hypothetical protein
MTTMTMTMMMMMMMMMMMTKTTGMVTATMIVTMMNK